MPRSGKAEIDCTTEGNMKNPWLRALIVSPGISMFVAGAFGFFGGSMTEFSPDTPWEEIRQLPRKQAVARIEAHSVDVGLFSAAQYNLLSPSHWFRFAIHWAILCAVCFAACTLLLKWTHQPARR